jgi:WD40 repeat protein
MLMLQGHRWGIRAVAFHPTNPTTLVSAGDDRFLHIWDLATGECQEREGHTAGILRLMFLANGQHLFSGARDGLLMAWELARPRPIFSYRASFAPIRCLILASSDAVLIVPDDQQQDEGQAEFPILGLSMADQPGQRRLPAPVAQAASARDGTVLAVARCDRQILLQVEDRAFTELAPQPFPQSISALRFSPDASLLALAWGPVVELYDWQAHERRAVCRGHKGLITSLAFSLDGRTLLTGSTDRSARLWDVATGKLRAAWRWDIGPIWSVAISPDDMLAAAGGQKTPLLVWDLDGV